jgi:hypothetical protein
MIVEVECSVQHPRDQFDLCKQRGQTQGCHVKNLVYGVIAPKYGGSEPQMKLVQITTQSTSQSFGIGFFHS